MYIFITGSLNDSGIWSNTKMCEALEKNTLSVPPARPLPNTDLASPFCLVGDEGFPLKKYLMRPYARKNLLGDQPRIFNYRLSRARRVIENAFGILVARWRVLQKPLGMKVETAEAIVQATTCLHNYIITTGENKRYSSEADVSNNIVTSNTFIQHLGRVGANSSAAAVMEQRDTLAQYFMTEQGSVPWQWQYI